MAGGPQQGSHRMCLFFASHRNLNTGRTGAAACLLDTQLHKLTASWGATLDTADLGLASYYAALKGIQKMSQQDRNATWSCRGNMNTWSATTRTGLAGAVPATWSFLNTPNVANNCAQFKAEEVSSRLLLADGFVETYLRTGRRAGITVNQETEIPRFRFAGRVCLSQKTKG